MEAVPIKLEQLKNGFQRAFYYDAEPLQKDGESDNEFRVRWEPYRLLRNQVEEVPSFFLREGVLRGVKPQRQKAVDVLLAVDMLSKALRNNFERATLLSGDLDFLPVVHALVEAGIVVTVWAEKRTAAKELLDAADSAHDFSFLNIYPQFCRSDFVSRFGDRRSVQRTAANLRNGDWTTIAEKGSWKILRNSMHGYVELVELPDDALESVSAIGASGGSEPPEILLKAIAEFEYGVNFR